MSVELLYQMVSNEARVDLPALTIGLVITCRAPGRIYTSRWTSPNCAATTRNKLNYFFANE